MTCRNHRLSTAARKPVCSVPARFVESDTGFQGLKTAECSPSNVHGTSLWGPITTQSGTKVQALIIIRRGDRRIKDLVPAKALLPPLSPHRTPDADGERVGLDGGVGVGGNENIRPLETPETNMKNIANQTTESSAFGTMLSYLRQ